MLIVDSLRADKFFEKNNSDTPTINSLLKNGTYFSQAISASDATILSWSSIFTGKFPFKTGIRSSKFNKLNPSIITLFDILQQKNYVFYGYLPQLSDTVGLFPNFKNEDCFYDFYLGLSNGIGEKLIEKLETIKEKPWFFLVHSMDLHDPINVSKKFDLERFGSNYYERKISEIDFWLGKVLEKIDLSNTIVILMSDHGSYIKSIEKNSKIINTYSNPTNDMLISKVAQKTPKFLKPAKDRLFFLREKISDSKKSKLDSDDLLPHEKRALMSGRADSKHYLFDERIRIPLILCGPGIKKNSIISRQVRTVDLLPTLCDLLKIPTSYDLDGLSMFADTTDQISSYAYIESNPLVLKESEDVIGIRTTDFKYFRDKSNPKNRIHLYDLNADPFEDKNLAETNIQKSNEFEQILENIIQNYENESENENELDSKEIENELKKLGYL